MSVINKNAKKQALDALLALGTLTAYLMKSTYVYSAAHKFVADLGANILAQVALTGVTTNSPNDGTLDTADHTFAAVTGSFITIWYAVNTGSTATSPLVFYNDAVTGFPGTITGGDVLVTVDNGTDRLFTL